MTDTDSSPAIPPMPQGTPTQSPPLPQPSVTQPATLKERRWLKWGSRANGLTKRGVTTPAFPNSGRKGRGKTAWYLAGGAAVLFMVGIGVGTTLPDPTKSEEFAALQLQKGEVDSELAKLQSRYNTLHASITGRESTISTKESAITVRESAVKAAEDNLKRREEAVTAAEKNKAANTIKEGTWTVGADIEPGTYRTTTEVSGSCYWGIYATGTNGSDIVDNDIVTGGRPSVTLSVGQDFKSSRCGSWLKQ